MKIKTSELTGAALDWAVAKCEGLLCFGWEDDMGLLKITFSTGEAEYYAPSIKWEQGGPIIEREGIATSPLPDNSWRAYAPMSTRVLNGRETFSWEHKGNGPTPLIAAMRCYVASKLGDEVDIPEELQ